MGLIEILVMLLVLSWIGGFAFHVGGALIHLLLVVAIVVFLLRYIMGSRTRP